MNYQTLNKILTQTIKDKFPEQIDDVIVNQDDFGEYNGRRLLDTRVIVVINNYEDLVKYGDEIKNYIRTLERILLDNNTGSKMQIVLGGRD